MTRADRRKAAKALERLARHQQDDMLAYRFIQESLPGFESDEWWSHPSRTDEERLRFLQTAARLARGGR